MICDNCYEDAQHRVLPNESSEFPAGPGIKVCHAPSGTYIHVKE